MRRSTIVLSNASAALSGGAMLLLGYPILVVLAGTLFAAVCGAMLAWFYNPAPRTNQSKITASDGVDSMKAEADPPLHNGTPPSQESRCHGVHVRLAEAYKTLEQIDRARFLEGDPQRDKATERRLIQRELLDLELQEIDEQIAKICDMSGKNDQ